MKSVTSAIYAGGRGRRMGGIDKSRLMLSGYPLFKIVSDKLRPISNEILVLSPELPDWLGEVEGARHIPDVLMDDQAIGPAGGLLAVLEHVAQSGSGDEVVLTHPVDVPLMENASLERLVSHALAHQRSAILSDGAGLQPAFGAWLVADLPRIELAVKSGERAIHRIHASVNGAVYEARISKKAFFNINTPEDLDEARQIVEGEE